MSLQHLTKAAKLTGDMMERRDRVKSLMGERYAAAIEQAAAVIRGIMQREKLDILPAAMWIAQKAVQDGHGEAVSIVVAAAVEMIEGKEHQ